MRRHARTLAPFCPCQRATIGLVAGLSFGHVLSTIACVRRKCCCNVLTETKMYQLQRGWVLTMHLKRICKQPSRVLRYSHYANKLSATVPHPNCSVTSQLIVHWVAMSHCYRDGQCGAERQRLHVPAAPQHVHRLSSLHLAFCKALLPLIVAIMAQMQLKPPARCCDSPVLPSRAWRRGRPCARQLQRQLLQPSFHQQHHSFRRHHVVHAAVEPAATTELPQLLPLDGAAMRHVLCATEDALATTAVSEVDMSCVPAQRTTTWRTRSSGMRTGSCAAA